MSRVVTFTVDESVTRWGEIELDEDEYDEYDRDPEEFIRQHGMESLDSGAINSLEIHNIKVTE